MGKVDEKVKVEILEPFTAGKRTFKKGQRVEMTRANARHLCGRNLAHEAGPEPEPEPDPEEDPENGGSGGEDPGKDKAKAPAKPAGRQSRTK